MGTIGSSPMARAVAESFFQLLRRERIRRRTYLTREAARQDVIEYIEMFFNPKRKHTNNGMLSPVDVETRQQKLNEAGVQEVRGTSVHKPNASASLRKVEASAET
jgi:transposase InsO family protein